MCGTLSTSKCGSNLDNVARGGVFSISNRGSISNSLLRAFSVKILYLSDKFMSEKDIGQ